MNKRILRVYDKEFKLSAIKLVLESGRSLREISRELGVPIATLNSWVNNHKKEGTIVSLARD